MRNGIIASVGLFSLGLIACSGALEAPPLDVAYRDSLVGIGKIVRITNTSAEALTDLEVRIENPNGDVKNHALPSLAGGETVELGWKKLDGFEVQMGAMVNVGAAGFVLPYRAELAESSESAER
jgi:hypothetical protein